MQPNLKEVRVLFEQICCQPDDPERQCHALLNIYLDLVNILSDFSSIQFNTVFARTSFIAAQYPIGRSWSHAMQLVRRELQKREIQDEKLLPILLGVNQYLLEVIDYAESKDKQNNFPKGPQLPSLPIQQVRRRFKKKFARVVAMSWDRNARQLTLTDEDEPDQQMIMDYAVAGVNDLFAETLEVALEEIGLPLVLGLSGIDYTADGHYVPSYIVILPDLLLDVTAVARLSHQQGQIKDYNLIDLFLPSYSNASLMTGNIANYILDELIRVPAKSYEAIFAETFKLFPLEFIRMDDDQVRALYRDIRDHYANIQKVIGEQFDQLGIDPSLCVIEPSFISPQYGIKGRLDLYYEHEAQRKASIIELKSSRPFKPNAYGLSNEHYHQTLLYDLLLRSTQAGDYKRTNYILYSAEAANALRFAVSLDGVQKEAIHHRNQLVVLYFRLMKQDLPDAPDIFLQIDPELYPELNGYVKRNVALWQEHYQKLSPGEQYYFRSFAAFITREHTLARIGSEQGEGSGGLAGLWLDSLRVKDDRYQLLSGLVLVDIELGDQQTILTFARTADTNPLANFRAGDIIVLYPATSDRDIDPSSFQLYKASVLDIDAKSVIVRLYNKQIHIGTLHAKPSWNIEPDLLDSSFRPYYQSLWSFVHTDERRRRLMLGLDSPPSVNNEGQYPVMEGLSALQRDIYRKGLDAVSLYLLWGPPGTGKTSMMLKAWAWYYAQHTSKRIILLAYTNRAVDEICDALHTCADDMSNQYIRIGSRSGTGVAYRHRLLDQVIQPMSTRAEIKQVLELTRIYVATISSLHGKRELLQMLDFDVAIVDEASQLLEPSVIGLLPGFKKTILIGDHLQLPAVSTQSPLLSRIKPGQQWAERIGLTDMGMSYFERLFRLYQSKGWNQHIGILHEQGRMHADIMHYVNANMYENMLRTADPVLQHVDLIDVTDGKGFKLFQERLLFIPSTNTVAETLLKTNRAEASLVVQLVEHWRKLLLQKNLRWSIGVITPFRAQIAAIHHEAHIRQIDMEEVTVDTVERYQGGARDIIIMSCAVNSRHMMRKIQSVTPEGLDRKLNVAITRARQQFILIGKEDILMQELSYRHLIEMCSELTAEEISPVSQ
jgi:DNA replication ATP-dependent helicase Dna2